MMHIYRGLATLLILLALAACGVSKRQRPSSGGTAVEQSRSALYQQLELNGQSWTALKGKLQGTINSRGKEVTARIQIQAARGQGIRLSAHVLLFEVARVWFTPQEVTFVDLVNGGYAQESYERFGQRLGITVDYGQIEALLLGAVFTPGKGATIRDLQLLAYAPLTLGEHQLSGETHGYRYSFRLSPSSVLRAISVENSRRQRLFGAEYRSSASQGLPTCTTPAESVYSLYTTGSGSEATSPSSTLSLEWQSVDMLESADGLSLAPIIKDKYTRIDLGAILKMLNR
ncbi:MAG: DUF4292 domain-containing protein [Porphyromonas sp.]|nr:DUF4292 domain-containing protein [Porphyromonas sp.]